jgi:nitrogen fixation NifU-like protein
LPEWLRAERDFLPAWWLQLSAMYSAQVLDHFQNPRNPGMVPDPDARVEIENPACGDVLELTARVEDRRIEEIRFRAKGCVAAMACASALTEIISGIPMSDARKVRREELLNKVGGLPEASAHAAYLAMDALQELLKKL